MATTPLWRPDEARIEQANLTAFRRAAQERWGRRLDDFAALYRWSIEERAEFWTSVTEHCGVLGQGLEAVALEQGDRMPGARWFPRARLNFAENLLRRRGDGDALVFWGEDRARRRLSWDALRALVSRLAAALAGAGVGPGDRVAAYLPNLPETVAAMLAAASLGAVWSSCSPDFGVQGVLDRFGQIEPRVLLAADGYHFKGRTHDCLGRVREIAARLPTVEQTVIVPYAGVDPDLAGIEGGAVTLSAFIEPYPAQAAIPFCRRAFDDPLYIMFSSGTTGAPKCIVHGVGGTLLQHLKEHRLHCDVRPGDRVFYYTTCGWMMWNWLASALASEATLLLYDGSPFHPAPDVLFDYADLEGMTLFGTSAKYLDALAKAGQAPRQTHGLERLRLISSTGSPLSPEGFDYVYQRIKPDLQLASISGGTDILGCFVCGNPVGPVWRGEIQTRALGMAVEVFDAEGRPVRGEQGDLVCTAPFPSMPLGFWNDPGGQRYRAAYFERFEGVWCHGDWAELTEHDGVIIYGRSDAVLNPSGVRIGTAEIYQQVEQLDEVVESIAVGQRHEGDVRIVLFVVLREGLSLDDALVQRIKTRLREQRSPYHVPAKVLQVPEIPRTKSGKITELAVADVVHGRPVNNLEALANPEALAHFTDRPELR
jgi:acetoacetyl-CoA synthetase